MNHPTQNDNNLNNSLECADSVNPEHQEYAYSQQLRRVPSPSSGPRLVDQTRLASSSLSAWTTSSFIDVMQISTTPASVILETEILPTLTAPNDKHRLPHSLRKDQNDGSMVSHSCIPDDAISRIIPIRTFSPSSRSSPAMAVDPIRRPGSPVPKSFKHDTNMMCSSRNRAHSSAPLLPQNAVARRALAGRASISNKGLERVVSQMRRESIPSVEDEIAVERLVNQSIGDVVYCPEPIPSEIIRSPILDAMETIEYHQHVHHKRHQQEQMGSHLDVNETFPLPLAPLLLPARTNSSKLNPDYVWRRASAFSRDRAGSPCSHESGSTSSPEGLVEGIPTTSPIVYWTRLAKRKLSDDSPIPSSTPTSVSGAIPSWCVASPAPSFRSPPLLGVSRPRSMSVASNTSSRLGPSPQIQPGQLLNLTDTYADFSSLNLQPQDGGEVEMSGSSRKRARYSGGGGTSSAGNSGRATPT